MGEKRRMLRVKEGVKRRENNYRKVLGKWKRKRNVRRIDNERNVVD